MKTCSHCKKNKRLYKFGNKSSAKDGKQSWCKLCFKKRYKKHKQEQIDRALKWQKNNPERFKEIRRKVRIKYKDIYKEKYRESSLESLRRYRQTPRGKRKGKIYLQRYRSRKKDAYVEDIPQKFIDRLLKRQKKRCLFCDRKFTKKRPYEVDHILPLTRGGLHKKSNIQLLCKSCNSSKRNRTDFEYLMSHQSTKGYISIPVQSTMLC